MVRPTHTNAQIAKRSLLRRETRPRAGAARYRVPAGLLASLITAAATGQKRSFAGDATAACKGISPQPLWEGTAHIPPTGPCLVTCNHTTRPGFGAWWIALSISAAIAAHREPESPQSIHWVMTAAWRYPPGDWRRRVITPTTRWAFARAARVYDFVTMPPMPPDPDETAERAASVLRTLRLARHLVGEGGMLGLAPEGRDTPERLGKPPKGAGAFIAQLVKIGLPVLPVGVAEAEGRLRVSFGPVFKPVIPAGPEVDRQIIDAAVAVQVMAAISRQLPD